MAHKIEDYPFGGIYDAYLAKVERKGRSEEELREVITWMTGYEGTALDAVRTDGTTMSEFFAGAPELNPARELVTGTICGVKIHEITDPLLKNIRQLDKLVDEIAKGRAMSKILRVDRRDALDQLTAEAYEAGLYEDSAENYREALKQARKKAQAD